MNGPSQPTIAAAGAVAGHPLRPGFRGFTRVLLRMRALFALVVLLVVFSASTPSFFTSNNLTILTKHVAITAI